MDGFVRFLARGVSQLTILLSKVKGRFSFLFKILIYIYPDSDLLFKQRKVTEYYELNTLNIFLKLR